MMQWFYWTLVQSLILDEYVRDTLEFVQFNERLETKITGNMTVLDLPNSKTLSQLITNSETIVCRSGYSTLMDLHHLSKTNLILIPTPSQPEQIYLAEYWQTKFGAKNLQQSKLKEKTN